MEELFDNIIRRRDRNGVKRDIIRGIIVNDIFANVVNERNVPQFNLDDFEDVHVKLYFRFTRQDIPRLARAPRIPEQIRTRSGYVATGKLNAHLL